MLVIGVHHFAQKKHGNEVTMKRFIITGIILLFTLTTIVFLHPAKPQHESIDNTTNSYEYYYNEKKDEEEEDSLLPEDLDSIVAENPTAPLDLVPSSITVLVNRTYLLPSSYTPANLVIPDVKFSFSYVSDKRKLRKVAANALEKLFEAAEKEDIELYGVSGYRSYARQKEIYDRNIAVRGQAATDAVSAKPGSSEHQTGLTIDVSSKSVNYRLDQSFGDTKEGKWLADHAHLYGFIIRYPYGKSDITGYSYEPWHIRFVGTTVATYLFEKNITLEEYYGAQSADDAPENAVDVEDPDSVKYATPKPTLKPTRKPSEKPEETKKPKKTKKPKETRKPKKTDSPTNTQKPESTAAIPDNPPKPAEKPVTPATDPPVQTQAPTVAPTPTPVPEQPTEKSNPDMDNNTSQ